MAYFKITQNKKGELQAKIQVSGKDLSTGKSKERKFRAPIRTAKRSSAQRC